MKTSHPLLVETLEARIAPAAVITFNDAAKTASWTDFDGDLVTLKYSSSVQPVFASSEEGVGLVVDRISLTVADHSNARFSLSVKPGPIGGDGHVDLGRVDAVGVPLKSWTSPKATIAEFDAGGIGKLDVGALGIVPYTGFDNTNGNGISAITGKTGSVTVRGDIGAARLDIATQDGIGSVTILGSLRGDWTGAGGTNGYVFLNAPKIGKVLIGGSIVGGDSTGDGRLAIFGSTGSVTVKGNILGGTGISSGTVEMEAVKTLVVGGNIVGGAKSGAGTLEASGAVGSFKLGGSLLGGSAASTGNIDLASATKVQVGGSIVGGKDPQSNDLIARIATLHVFGDLKSFTLGGDLVAGTQDFAPVSYHGALIVGGKLGNAVIKGSLIGNSDSYATILVAGNGATAGDSIGKLTIVGSVEDGYIAAGHGINTNGIENRIGNAENLNASIGSVTVGGSWIHSNLSAGVSDENSTGLNPGDNGGDSDPALIAVIRSINIKGPILENSDATGTSGFAAEKILSLKTGGVTVFTTGSPNLTLDRGDDVLVFEVTP